MPYTPILATLGYVFSPDGSRVLLIHRNTNPNDLHLGKYNGLGGKLDRAEEHRLEFDHLVEEYVGGEPFTIYSQYDPQTGWHTLRWQALRRAAEGRRAE